MTIAQGAAEADVRIRVGRLNWMLVLLIGGVALLNAAVHVTRGQSWAFLIFVGFLLVGEGLWIRSFGVVLTPESVKVRGRRSIPWRDVQAVVRFDQLGGRRVGLILESGEPVNLRAPESMWGFGRAAYERDFQRIGQWWLAHRGESWRPVRPEAPRQWRTETGRWAACAS